MTLFKVCVVFVEKKSNMSAIARQIFNTMPRSISAKLVPFNPFVYETKTEM
jgi:hypothetical protein